MALKDITFVDVALNSLPSIPSPLYNSPSLPPIHSPYLPFPFPLSLSYILFSPSLLFYPPSVAIIIPPVKLWIQIWSIKFIYPMDQVHNKSSQMCKSNV